MKYILILKAEVSNLDVYILKTVFSLVSSTFFPRKRACEW